MSREETLGGLVTFRTGKLNSNAGTPDGAYPFFTCAQETYRTSTYAFDTECVLLAGNNANGIYPIKYFAGRFDAYQRTYVIESMDQRRLLTRYLFYALQLQLEHLRSISTGAATKFLTLTLLKGIKIPLPSLCEQKRVASILSAYDDLIENNAWRIAILEEMARRVYEEWFVRFRFPGHEGVRMVESELGLVPEGWAITELGALLSVEKGLSYKGSGLTGNGVPMVNLKNILPGGGFRRDGTKPYSGEYKAKHIVRAGDIVLANTDLTQAGTVVGSPAIVPDMGVGECIFSHHLYAIRLPTAMAPSRPYVYWLLAHDSFKSFAKGHAVGTTVLGMPKEGVTNFRFARPPEDLMRRFSSLAAPIRDLAETLHAKNTNVRATRDLLLPRLISGELDVSAMREPKALAA